MDQKKAMESLEIAIRSRIPVIGIQTTEERRVVENIKSMMARPLLSNDGKRIVAGPRLVVKWSYTTGLQTQEPADNVIDESGKLMAAYQEAKMILEEKATFEPADAIADFLKWAMATDQKFGEARTEKIKARASVLLLCDIHRFIMPKEAGGAASIQTIRALRDLFQGLEATKSHAILIAPTLANVGDSDTEITRIDFPLPTTRELTALVQEAANMMRNSLPVSEEILNGGAEVLAQALSGITWTQASHILRQAMVQTHSLGVKTCAPIIADMKAATLKRNQGIELTQPVPITDIGGLDLLKADVAKYPRLMNSDAKEEGIRPPQAILFCGPPGTGKSWTCKVIGGGVLPTMRWSPAQSKSMYVGKSIENATNVLKSADAINNCVLWIDEVDLIFGDSTAGDKHEVSQELLQLMLTWLEERESDVIVVMTTNHPKRLPGAFRDRCDERWFVDLPRNVEEAREVINVHLRRNRVELNDEDTDMLARIATDGELNPRNMAQGIRSAKRRAFLNEEKLTAEYLFAEYTRRVEANTDAANMVKQMRKEALAWATPASSAVRERKAKVVSDRTLDV